MAAERTAVALGLFDGVHLGHRAVLKLAAEQKKRIRSDCVYFFSEYDNGQEKQIRLYLRK